VVVRVGLRDAVADLVIAVAGHQRIPIQELRHARQPAQRIVAVLCRLIRLVGLRRHPPQRIIADREADAGCAARSSGAGAGREEASSTADDAVVGMP